jgi:DNA primase
MPRLDQSVIRELHTRIDIASYIGQFVSLKKRGRDLVGLCPFHGEKTPSFHVHPEQGFFKCFGCGAGGDVIAFVMKLENLHFADAARMLANKAGIALEEEDPRAARRRTEREAIYEANALAVAYFEKMLRAAGGAEARAYCERRGFGQAVVDRFHLGYAPDAWSGLTDELRANGVELALAEKAGLVKPSQRGGYYDFYRNRLMVPTYATTGEVIAFGGRDLGNGEPKYLNTTTTPVYTKGEHLFALNVARRAAQNDRTLIVVEGYLDCVALHQAGFEGTVAALGTSFTERQAAELRKYADYIYLCFDADAAGSNAATKAVDIASKVIEHTGSSVRVVSLPHGDDPDSFVRQHGADAFRALLDAAKPSIEFKLDPEIDRLRSGFESPAAIARKAEVLIRELTPREEWDRWRVYVAGRLKVNVDDLRNSRFLANPGNFSARAGVGGTIGTRHVSMNHWHGSTVAERQLLSVLLEDPTLISEFGGRLDPQQFADGLHRSIFERMAGNAGNLRSAADVFAMFADDGAALEVINSLVYLNDKKTSRDELERRAHLEGAVGALSRAQDERRRAELNQIVLDVFEAGEPVPHEVAAELENLERKLKK